MKEVWFFLIRTNTDYIKKSCNYVTFEDAEKERREWRSKNIFEEPITPVMKGYVKESK